MCLDINIMLTTVKSQSCGVSGRRKLPHTHYSSSGAAFKDSELYDFNIGSCDGDGALVRHSAGLCTPCLTRSFCCHKSGDSLGLAPANTTSHVAGKGCFVLITLNLPKLLFDTEGNTGVMVTVWPVCCRSRAFDAKYKYSIDMRRRDTTLTDNLGFECHINLTDTKYEVTPRF